MTKSFFRRLHGDQSGATAILVAITMSLVVVGFGGVVVDLGLLFHAQRELQDSADASALAGAQNINVGSGGTALGEANTYSAVTGNDNANANLTVTMVSGYPVLKCLSSTGISCSGPDSANAIVVKEQASVPLYFAKVFGINSWTLTATSTAGARGGATQSLDVVIILDTTASMTDADASCSESGATREVCAQTGIQAMLSDLWPCAPGLSTCGTATNGSVANPLDQVALMVFPGLKNAAQAVYDYNCGSTSPTTVGYNSSPDYLVLGFHSDYRTSDSASSLNTSSNLVRAVSGGGSGCSNGIQAPGGFGTFYADVITAAQSYLTTSGRSTSQKVIILVTDGGANASTTSSAEKNQQCHEAITAAAAATSAGTWVYSIAYGAQSTGTSTCTTDTSPTISSCTTMQDIASNGTMFFADQSGGDSGCTSPDNPSVTDLNTIFKQIVTGGSSPRLLPDNTT